HQGRPGPAALRRRGRTDRSRGRRPAGLARDHGDCPVNAAPADEREFMPQVGDDLPPGQRPMVAVIRAVPGHEQHLAAAIATLTTAVRREQGCLEFRPFQDVANPAVFYLYEIYADTGAFRVHLATGHVAHFFTELAQHSTTDATALVQLVELHAP